MITLDGKTLMSVDEVMKFLNVQRYKITRLEKSGQLKATKYPRMFEVANVKKLLNTTKFH